MQIDFNKRVALVTGSDRNTGATIARRLAQSNATVIIHSNLCDGNAAVAAKNIGQPYSVEGDIATEAGCDAIMQQLQDSAPTVDILINNYGTATFAKWASVRTDDWLDMYQKNVLCAARLAQGLAPQMKKQQWGRIVNLGTIGSHRPGAIMPHYYAAKSALANLGVSLMQDLAGSGITVNTVSPGLIHTPDVEASYRAKARKKGWGESWHDIERNIATQDFPNPCARLCKQEEVADLVAFLCSENAGFINGQNIRIDGGAIAYV